MQDARRFVDSASAGEAAPLLRPTVPADPFSRHAPAFPHQTPNLVLLALCYAIFVATSSGHLIVSSLASEDLGHESLATLPMAFLSVGEVLACVPASLATGRVGRKACFVVGGVLGAGALLLCALAIRTKSFALLLGGSFVIGVFCALACFLRYAAAEACPPRQRARAVSRVVFGGAILSLVGPQTVRLTHLLGGFTEYYLAAAGLVAMFAVLCAMLRLPSPKIGTTVPNEPRASVAFSDTEGLAIQAELQDSGPFLDAPGPPAAGIGANYGDDASQPQQPQFPPQPAVQVEVVGPKSRARSHTRTELELYGPARPLSVIMRSPAILLAMVAQFAAYWCMVVVMVATPLAMKKEGLGLGDSVVAIQCHLLGMFLPGFVTGSVIDRIGMLPVLLGGLAFFGGTIGILLSGNSLAHFVCGLVTLGIGWNLTFISGTRLLLLSHRESESSKAQAVNEMFVQGANFGGSFLAGFLLHKFGWTLVVLTITPAVALTLAMCAAYVVFGRR